MTYKKNSTRNTIEANRIINTILNKTQMYYNEYDMENEFNLNREQVLLELNQLMRLTHFSNVCNPIITNLDYVTEKQRQLTIYSKNEFIELMDKTISIIQQFSGLISPNDDNPVNNTEKYYTQKIQELEKRETELKNSLNSKEHQTESQKKKTKLIEDKLLTIENELKEKKEALENKQKQEDAKADWENKINTTFTKLSGYLKPIQTEHNRLNILYYIYALLTVITLIIIVIIEITTINKISSNTDFPKMNELLTLYLPLPIAGALMWGFIVQMNRAQRQLILIANNIHSINYIEGLLLSINNLSPDVNDGISRINTALDKVIENHLNKNILKSESELVKEEGKDNIDIDKVLKIINSVNKTVK